MTSANIWRLALIAFVALVLQVAVFDQIVVVNAHPDVMVVLVAAGGMVGGPQRGAILGFIVGLVADLVVSTPYGLAPLTFVLLGFGVGMLRAIPAGRDSLGAQVATLVAAAAVGTLLFAVFGAIFGQRGLLGTQVIQVLLVVAIGALVFAVPALRTVEWVLAGSSQTRDVGTVPRGGSALE